MQIPHDIYVRYIERRKMDLENCLMNFEGENFTELERVGHKLKGNGKTFGHEEITDIGATMERAAQEKDVFEMRQALEKLSDWVDGHLN